MARHHKDWISAFMAYAQWMESPRHMHFWTAVSTVAGALRRKVWFREAYYTWYPSFYIIIVAPPGVVSKSTTAGIGMNLLKKVPDINFGPDVVTMPALTQAFSRVGAGFEVDGLIRVMSPLTIVASELGNLLNMQDAQMINLLIELWDGRDGVFKKDTKTAGSDEIVNAWINMIGCTTPSWIAGNIPEYMLEGGLASRCIFVYAEKKEKLVAYPSQHVPPEFLAMEADLVADLTHISQNIAGEYVLTREAKEWGNLWYEAHNKHPSTLLDRSRFGGYASRKQSHMHKLAIVLAASTSDRLVIEAEHLATADQMITDLEPDMAMVFAKIGRSEEAIYIEKLIELVHAKGRVSFMEAYRHVHAFFPSLRAFEDTLSGAIRAGYLLQMQAGTEMFITKGPAELPSSARSAGGASYNGKPALKVVAQG